MRPVRTSLIVVALVAGCAEFPEVDAAISPEARRAQYPVLVPIDPILELRKLARTSPIDGELVNARAERLRARAQLLRGIRVSEATRERLSPTLNRLGG